MEIGKSLETWEALYDALDGTEVRFLDEYVCKTIVEGVMWCRSVKGKRESEVWMRGEEAGKRRLLE